MAVLNQFSQSKLLPNPQFGPTGGAILRHTVDSANVWRISDAHNKNMVILPWNPAFDSDTDTQVEGVVNIGLNLGASSDYIQPVGIHSPKREIGTGNSLLYIDRRTRAGLNAIYRRQYIDGYIWIHPRIPYSGVDHKVRVFMEPYKTTRTVLAGGDLYSMIATFIYLDLPKNV